MKVLELDKFVAHLNDEIEECYDYENGEDLQKRDIARGTRLGLNMAKAVAATIARYEAMGEWISIEDSRKPYHTQECLIAYVFGDSTHLHYDVARYDEVYGNGYVDGPHFSNEGVAGMRVTHWMPMPKIPKKEIKPND